MHYTYMRSCVLKAIVRAGLHITNGAASEPLPVSSDDLRELTTDHLNEEVDKGHKAPWV